MKKRLCLFMVAAMFAGMLLLFQTGVSADGTYSTEPFSVRPFFYGTSNGATETAGSCQYTTDMKNKMESSGWIINGTAGTDYLYQYVASSAPGRIMNTGTTSVNRFVYGGAAFGGNYDFTHNFVARAVASTAAQYEYTVFNYVDANNYYFLKITPTATTKVELYKNVGGQPTLITTALTTLSTSVWDIFTITIKYREGGNITAIVTKSNSSYSNYVGTSLSATDTEFTSGYVGFGVNCATIGFDYLYVNPGNMFSHYYSDGFSDASTISNWNGTANKVSISSNSLLLSYSSLTTVINKNAYMINYNYNYNVDVYKQYGNGNYAYIVFNYTNDYNYYAVKLGQQLVNSVSQCTVSLVKKVNGVESVIDNCSYVLGDGILPNNTLQNNKINVNISYQINGKIVAVCSYGDTVICNFTATDTVLDSGSVGALMYATPGNLYNFKLDAQDIVTVDKSITFNDAKVTSLASVANQSVNISADLRNNTGSSIPYVIYVALAGADGSLKCVKPVTGTLASAADNADGDIVNFTFTLPSDTLDTDYIELFYWDINLKPYACKSILE